MNNNISQNYVTIWQTLSSLQVGDKFEIDYNKGSDPFSQPVDVKIRVSLGRLKSYVGPNSYLGSFVQAGVRQYNKSIYYTLADRKNTIKWLKNFTEATINYAKQNRNPAEINQIYQAIKGAEQGLKNLTDTYTSASQMDLLQVSLRIVKDGIDVNQLVESKIDTLNQLVETQTNEESKTERTQEKTNAVSVYTDDIIDASAIAYPSSSATPIEPAGGPPPPPPPPLQVKPKKFQDEPDAPKFKAQDYNQLDEQQLNEQKQAIYLYLNNLKSSLAPVQKVLEEVQTLEKALKDSNEELANKKETFGNYETSLKTLTGLENISYKNETLDYKENNQIVYLFVKSTAIPYYPDQQFAELNEGKKKPYPEAFKKSVAVKFNYKMAKKEWDEIQPVQERIAKLKTQLEEVKKTTNNGFNFDDFEKLMKQKNEQVTLWENGIKNREKKLAKLLKGDLSVSIIAPPVEKEEVQEENTENELDVILKNKDLQNLLISLRKFDDNPELFYLSQSGIGEKQ